MNRWLYVLYVASIYASSFLFTPNNLYANSNSQNISQQKSHNTFRDYLKTISNKIVYYTNKLQLKYIEFSYPKVITTTETLKEILKGKSIARLGDGELELILGFGLDKKHGKKEDYQSADHKLSLRLKEILSHPRPNCLTAINNFKSKYSDKEYFKGTFSYWESVWLAYWHGVKDLYNYQYKYGCAAISRLDVFYENKLDDIKKLWDNRKVLFVVGCNSQFVYPKELFDNIKDAIFLIVKGQNSFSDYDKILNQIIKVDKDYLILLAIGPTSTVLAYDLSASGYQALDIGHLPNCYLQYLGERKAPEDEVFIANPIFQQEGIFTLQQLIHKI